mmetsp:Transcript_4716/g.10326  ORF Transcript_4716/g.10326 Transcript_4716/m.10326 type:complete len:88 (-) Transcript_4716:53-316(-)
MEDMPHSAADDSTSRDSARWSASQGDSFDQDEVTRLHSALEEELRYSLTGDESLSADVRQLVAESDENRGREQQGERMGPFMSSNCM